ncbi:uncharacterized protein [Watersipora subatra]|uniref:uncharacterized protein n=1 Tax=Watersipora subatra TaxID=2589382 RepID=UPI00355BFFAA
MRIIRFHFLLMTGLALVQVATGLQCWVCKATSEDDSCWTDRGLSPDNDQQVRVEECKQVENLTSVCLKVVMREHGKKIFLGRDCGLLESVKESCIDTSYDQLDAKTCSCQTDLCNAASSCQTGLCNGASRSIPSICVILLAGLVYLTLSQRLWDYPSTCYNRKCDYIAAGEGEMLFGVKSISPRHIGRTINLS